MAKNDAAASQLDAALRRAAQAEQRVEELEALLAEAQKPRTPPPKQIDPEMIEKLRKQVRVSMSEQCDRATGE